MNFHSNFLKLLIGKELTSQESEKYFSHIFSGDFNVTESKAVLCLLAKRGESATEVLGCLKAIRKLEPVTDCGTKPLIDTAGTGGDGKNTFNISTLASFVIAGAGIAVAKHGNRSVSSTCGSSDLLEALGATLSDNLKKNIACLKKVGYGYFHAPFFHPTFTRFQSLRREMKIKTIFNKLGPLLNPCKLTGQIVGVSNEKDLSIYAELLKSLTKNHRALVFHSSDGLDEISVNAVTHGYLVQKGKTEPFRFDPKTLDLKSGSLKGGTARENASVAIELLRNKSIPNSIRDAVLINAAAGIWVANLAKDLSAGYRIAQQSLNSGAALLVFNRFLEASRK